MVAVAAQEIAGVCNNRSFATPPRHGLSLNKRSGGRRQLSNFRIDLRENPRTKTSSNANATVLDGVTTDEPHPKSTTGQYTGKKAVVIGAGPAGTVAAVFLAKRGFDVKIFEKRSHPSSVPSNVHRSIPLTLNPKASAIVRSIGATIPKQGFKDGMHRAAGSVFISDKGIQEGGSRLKEECIFGERHSIASNIIKAAEGQNLPNLGFFYDMPCEGVDIEQNVVKVGGQLEEYDLLVGADGTNSVVRKGLEKNRTDFEAVQYAVRSRYKSFRDIPAPAKAKGPFFESVKPGTLAFVNLKKTQFRGPQAIVIYTNDSGMFQGSFLGTTDSLDAIEGRELQWLTEAVPSVFPKEWLEPIANQLKTASESVIGPVTCCSSLVGPKIALLGDACHSVTPTFGIGANLAIRDTLALDEAMDFGDGDVDSALKNYNKEWHPQVDSIMTLEKMGPILSFQGDSTPWQKLGGMFFAFHVKFHGIGNKFLPWLIPQSVYRRIFSSELNGVQALRTFRREGVMVVAFIITAIYKTIAALARIAMGAV
ncbi:hypothetical protein BSKO_12726 [Bryopsis sp. KO-2023]|nr:hypothetical protein BSKO_12726 [Bryopsis sp. KO-2023]